jgi:hypothetical protein
VPASDGGETLEVAMTVDTEAPIRFLRTAYEPDDWVAVFLKSYDTGQTLQRVGPVSLFLEPKVHAWLRAMNARRFNVYVGVNAVREGQRTRTKDAIAAVRHIFLEADEDGPQRLAEISARPDLPPLSYVLESSPGRLHFFWRVGGFSTEGAERLQKHLARVFGTDPAATSCSQTTRIAGYQNHKRTPSHLITVRYGHPEPRYTPDSFPQPPAVEPTTRPPIPQPVGRRVSMDVAEPARRYLERVEPAIAGQHGDLHTFKVCCRIVRGFALSDEEALIALADWNARCAPPWSEHELCDKINRARRYGREEIGGLFTAPLSAR